MFDFFLKILRQPNAECIVRIRELRQNCQYIQRPVRSVRGYFRCTSCQSGSFREIVSV